MVQHNELEMSHGGGRVGILFIIGCVVCDFNTNWCLKSLLKNVKICPVSNQVI